ncbi:MAG: hypothetical protein ACN6OP_18650 [Pseudomonadales bacterium]
MKRALLPLSLLLMASPVWAANCSEPTPGMGKTEISDISQTIPRDVPVDTVIYTKEIREAENHCSCIAPYGIDAGVFSKEDYYQQLKLACQVSDQQLKQTGVQRQVSVQGSAKAITVSVGTIAEP